jgi:hypothetical protein
VGPLSAILSTAKRTDFENGYRKLKAETARFLLEVLAKASAPPHRDVEGSLNANPPGVSSNVTGTTRQVSGIVGPQAADVWVQLSTFDLESIQWSHFAVNEHVFSFKDGGEQFLTPDAGTALESVSECPQVAIKYAYGIHPDSTDLTCPAFYRSIPNEPAAIAMLSSEAEKSCLSLDAYNRVLGAAEAARRINRDKERFVVGRVAATQVIKLPPFDANDPIASLDRAANELVACGAAEFAP